MAAESSGVLLQGSPWDSLLSLRSALRLSADLERSLRRGGAIRKTHAVAGVFRMSMP
jgi:hypothetical protein